MRCWPTCFPSPFAPSRSFRPPLPSRALHTHTHTPVTSVKSFPPSGNHKPTRTQIRRRSEDGIPFFLRPSTKLFKYRSRHCLLVRGGPELCSRIILDTIVLMTQHMSEQSRAARIRTTETRPLTTDHCMTARLVNFEATMLLRSSSSLGVHALHDRTEFERFF